MINPFAPLILRGLRALSARTGWPVGAIMLVSAGMMVVSIAAISAVVGPR